MNSRNSGGPLAFILDYDKLVAGKPTSVPSPSPPAGRYYVVAGDLTNSILHSRYSVIAPAVGTMPPADIQQPRPTAADRAILDNWITNCVNDPTAPMGWPAITLPPIGPFDACGPGNVCPSGSCCVFKQCVPNGMQCGPLKNPTAGLVDLPGLAGTCNMGSCQLKAGGSCGKVNEPCCDLNVCTAIQSTCLAADTSKCSQCGGTGEPCCFPNDLCIAGRSCQNGGVGHQGTCALCGDPGQPCCGAGVTAKQTCNMPGFVCVATPAASAPFTTACQSCGAAGQPCCLVAGVDTCNGTLTCVDAAAAGDGGVGKSCLAVADAGGQ